MPWGPKPDFFFPTNPGKYIGDVRKIIYRSSWEKNFCRFLDLNENVEKWSSEEVVIPYVLNGQMHRYFPDYYVKFKSGKHGLIEIKPHEQSIMPQAPKRRTPKALRRFEEGIATFEKNDAKWAAAREFCQKRGMFFLVFTEHELSSLGFIFT